MFIVSFSSCTRFLLPLPSKGGTSPLSSPVHQLVSYQQRHSPEEDLCLRPPVDVEDCGICGTGQSALAVLSETVGDDTLLRWGTFRPAMLASIGMFVLMSLWFRRVFQGAIGSRYSGLESCTRRTKVTPPSHVPVENKSAKPFKSSSLA